MRAVHDQPALGLQFVKAAGPHKLRGQRVHRGLRPAVARLVGVVGFDCGRYQTSSTFVRWAGENRWAHILSEVVCSSTGLVAGPGGQMDVMLLWPEPPGLVSGSVNCHG